MDDPAKLFDEAGRLAALQRYDILDTDPEGPFDKITALVRTILGVPMAAVSLVDANRQWFKARQGLDACETPRDVSFCAHAIRASETMVIVDARADPRFQDNPLVTGSPFVAAYAGAPLRTPDGYNIGALCAIDTQPRAFDPSQIAILGQLASLVMDSIELRQIADRDHLTGALTRRALIAEMDREIERHARYHRSASLMLIDIDHFKAINDSHGHPVGDEVLKAIAACCEAQMRPSDFFGRIGGEEFAILLPETDADDAMLVAERLRGSVRALVIDVLKGAAVTASFGIAALTPDCVSSERWLARADEGLYSAKRTGRDRCCIAGAAIS